MGTKRALHERSPPGLDIVPASQRPRLSFSNSDLSDNRQLDALYERCLDQVLRGFHPVSRDTAIRLAAIHCFVQFGPFRDGIQNSIRAYNLLPKEYVHAREHEKNIAEQYRNLVFPDEIAARRKYCEICKNLPTYGMIFFDVKEPDGNKLVPRLFGVNKDCVMSVDKKTKVVRKSWPLEQLRRWAASPTTFNIDFGDYQDGYYSVQTLEGDKIKKLIAEFVDIILIKKQIVDPFGLEGDEGAIMIEDYVFRARSVPLSMADIQKRLGSPLGDGGEFPPPIQQNQKQLPPEPRSPFVPLENQLFPEHFQQRPAQPVPWESPTTPSNAGQFPRATIPQQMSMAQPVQQIPIQKPKPPADQYDQLPFQMPQQSTPSPPSHHGPPAAPMPYPRTVPMVPAVPIQFEQTPPTQQIVPQATIAAPSKPPHTTQSLPHSLVNSVHQQLISSSANSASIAAFTSHDIGYEIFYKEGYAHRSFQQHFQSNRNLQGFSNAIDQGIRRLKDARTTLGTSIGVTLTLDQEEREQAIQVGDLWEN